nr:MAG TPA: hypothetical protein [Caudoviricetes sp.]
MFRQLKRKNYYFLQLYLTGVLHPLDELQNMPHNACRIRNDPKTNTISISKCSQKCKRKKLNKKASTGKLLVQLTVLIEDSTCTC